MEVAYKLIAAFVTLILGVALIGPIAHQTNTSTDLTVVASESHSVSPAAACPAGAINTSYIYTLTNAPIGWKVSDCPVTSFTLTNSSGTAFVLDTDYTLYTNNGTYTLANTALVNSTCASDNVTLAGYDYCADTYLNSSWGRSVLDMVAGFFAIALMLVGVGFFYSIGKDLKII